MNLHLFIFNLLFSLFYLVLSVILKRLQFIQIYTTCNIEFQYATCIAWGYMCNAKISRWFKNLINMFYSNEESVCLLNSHFMHC